MSQPTTPVRVPRAASTYSPESQDLDLRSQINAVLLREGHITKIHEALTNSLSMSPTNWPTAIRNHALALLRSGECTTFPALMARITADVKAATSAEKYGAAGAANGTANGAARNGSDKGTAGIEHLGVPKSVIEEGVRVTKECLESVCEMD